MASEEDSMHDLARLGMGRRKKKKKKKPEDTAVLMKVHHKRESMVE